MADSGSMTNPSEALIDGLSPIERLAEHLCARRPCGDTPENVADWLDYSLNRCGLVVIEEQRLAQQAATPAAPVPNDDAEWLRGLVREGVGRRFDTPEAERLMAIANRLTPDPLLVEALTIAVAALGRVNVRCFDDAKSPLKPIGDIAREGLSGIAETLGDKAYDEIAMEANDA